jgi:hypothetical protein
MSLFSLPTAASKPDSYSSAYRVDEVNPTSTVNSSGGGAATFEFTSPANNWFIPKLSYFDVRLKITETAAETSAITAIDAADGATGSLAIQFAEYPASHLVETFSHSINGANLETISDCAELSAMQSRTMFPKDYHETFASSFRLAGGTDLLGASEPNSTSTAPGGSLQPWDGTTTTFSCKYQPPSALFKYAGSLPGLRQRMVLTLASNLHKAVVAKNAASLTSTITIESIKFYAAHVVPEMPIAPPPTVVLSLPMMAVIKQYHAGSSQTQTFSVAPSTDKVYVAKNSTSVGDGTVANAAHMFASDFKSIEIQYAGQRAPSVGYSSLESGNTERDNLRAYLDYAATTGRLFRSQGMPEPITKWQERPIYGASFEKPANDQSTNLIVRSNATAAGNTVVAYRHHKVVVISYGADGIASTVDIQEDLS